MHKISHIYDNTAGLLTPKSLKGSQPHKLDHKESCMPKNWCFQTTVLEKTLESPPDSKIKLVNPKGNQLWIFIGRADAEAEVPILLWPPDAKSQLIGKDPDAGKDWRQEKGLTEDKMFWWNHWLNGLEFEQAPGDSERQGSLVWCSPWGHKESDTTERLNNNKFKSAQSLTELLIWG